MGKKRIGEVGGFGKGRVCVCVCVCSSNLAVLVLKFSVIACLRNGSNRDLAACM